MQPGARKFFTNERSIPKQSKPSYQQVSHTEKDLIHPYYAQYPVRRQLTKTSSDADLKNPKEQYFKNLNQRRKNEGQMSNLKSQLQNLKNQVNKLISKDSTLRTPQKQRPAIKQQRSDKKVNYVTKGFHDELTDREQDFSDTASMVSVTTQKVLNQPLRRLEKKVSSQNYDQGYYMQLENDLLKTEIKNLKNKYVSKKRQLTEKCDLLEKKNQYLEVNLQKSQESLVQCRKALEMEIMIIKRQITLKTEIKNDIHLPETDKPNDFGDGNEMLQQKLKNLYDEMTKKNNLVNNLSIEVGDLEAMLDRKKFDLKKESEKNLQLSKQLELTKRESSRLQILVQTEMSKKKDLQKQNDTLKQKNKDLMEEIYKKEQIVTGSEQYQNRIYEELELYKKKQDELQMKLSTLREENKKLKQLISTNNDEISSLKKSNDDTISRIGQLSRKLKDQQQKSFEKEDYYRRLLDQSKRKQQERVKILKDHYQQQYSLKTGEEQTAKDLSKETNDLLRQKERQVNRWKAEYKILKLKHQENHNSEIVKKTEVEQYYKGFIQFKNKAQLLQDRNNLLQRSVDNYLKKLNEKESEAIKIELEHRKQVQNLNQQISKLQHQVQSLNDELSLAKSQLGESILRNEEESKYRHELQVKIEHFIEKRLKGESSEEEDNNVNSNEELQDQQNEIENLNQKKQKYFHQDDEEFYESPKAKKKMVRKQKKSKTQKSTFEPLTQSQKIQLQQLSESITTIKKRIIQQDEKLAKNVRQLKNKDSQINKLKKQIRELLQAHEKQLFEIKDKYTGDKADLLIKTSMDTEKEVKELCQKEIQIHKEKQDEVLAQNVEMKRKISQIEKQLLDLRQQTKSLSHLYNVKCSEVEELIEKNLHELQMKEKKIDELQMLKQQRQKNFLNDISNLKDQISILRLDIKNLTSINQKIEVSSFDEALRNQIQTSNTLREELAKKNDEIFKVRDNYTLLRSQYDNLRSENQIEKLKNLSQRKNLEVQYQIQIQNLKNKLNVEEKKASSLEQKISLVIEENKKKDSFIQSYIMGKKLPQGDKEFVAQFIKQYEILLNGKSINEKLRADSHELQKMATYNYRLLKDMADMKERMLLYETMEGEALSLYDSRQSGELNRQNDIDSPIKSLNQSPKSPNIKFKKMSSLVDVKKDI